MILFKGRLKKNWVNSGAHIIIYFCFFNSELAQNVKHVNFGNYLNIEQTKRDDLKSNKGKIQGLVLKDLLYLLVFLCRIYPEIVDKH